METTKQTQAQGGADVERIAKQYAHQARETIQAFGFTVRDPILANGGKSVIEKAIYDALTPLAAENARLSGENERWKTADKERRQQFLNRSAIVMLSREGDTQVNPVQQWEIEIEQLRAELAKAKEENEVHKAVIANITKELLGDKDRLDWLENAFKHLSTSRN
jgi:hypothetical protein